MRSLLAAAVLALGVEAQAAPCAGLTDVDSTSPFCAGVAWLKNRGVTSGCTATLYCPNDPVTRLAMAAFLSRLDRVLPPTVVDANGVALGPVVAQRGHDLTVAYRTPATPDRVHLLPLFMVGVTTLHYVQPYYLIKFVTANCTGVGYLEFTQWPPPLNIVPQFHAGSLSVIANGTGGERWLYSSVSSPLPAVVTPGQVVVASQLDNGTCTAFSPTPLLHALPMSQVENVAAKYPFVLR